MAQNPTVAPVAADPWEATASASTQQPISTTSTGTDVWEQDAKDHIAGTPPKTDPFPSKASAGFTSAVGQGAEDLGKGVLEGAGDTVSGVGHLLRKIPGIKDYISEEGLAALDKVDVPANTTQSVGKGLEFAGELAIPGLGEETGLGMAAKLVKMAKEYPILADTLNLATQHPWLAKVITEGGSDALKTVFKGAAKGAMRGAEREAIKGAQHDQAGVGALSGAVGGAVGGAAGEVLPVVAGKTVQKLMNPYRKVAAKFTGSEIQPALKSGLQDVWNTVADEAKVARPTSASIQDMGEQVGDALFARAKSNYKLIDSATNNRFSGTEEALRNANLALRSVKSDAEEVTAMARKTRLEWQMNQLLDEAASKGVSKDVIGAAKADFKKAQAIYDTNAQIRMSTSGVRTGKPGSEMIPEEVDPKKLLNRFNKMYNTGRLHEAVGEDAADNLILHSAVAQKAAKDVASRKLKAEIVGGAVGVEGVIRAGEAISNLRKK